MKKSEIELEKKRLENKQLVIEELRNTYERKYSASDVLDGKLQNMFNFLSIVVSIAPTLEVMINPNPDKMSIFFVILLVAILILYYISFSQISSAMKPMYYRQPISNDWDVLREKYFDATKEQVFNRIISDYLLALENIGEKNDKKIATVRQVSNLMATIVVLLVLAVPINVFFPSPALATIIRIICEFISKVKP